MIENIALYLPAEEVGFSDYFENVTLNESTVEITTDIGVTVVRIRRLEDHPKQIDGFRGYIMQAQGTDEQKGVAVEMLENSILEVGVVFPVSIESTDELFQTFSRIVEDKVGFLFVWSSIWTPDGFLVGPMLNQ